MIVGLYLTNNSAEQEIFPMSSFEERLVFGVAVTTPKHRTHAFRTYGCEGGDWAGERMIGLLRGKTIEEHIDIGPYLNAGPGDYQITINESYDKLQPWEGTDLKIDVKLKVTKSN